MIEVTLPSLGLIFKRPDSFCFCSSCHARSSSTLRLSCFECSSQPYERLPSWRRGRGKERGAEGMEEKEREREKKRKREKGQWRREERRIGEPLPPPSSPSGLVVILVIPAPLDTI